MPTCTPNTILLNGKALQALSEEGLRLYCIGALKLIFSNGGIPGVTTPTAVMSRGKAYQSLDTQGIRNVIYQALCILSSGGTCSISILLSTGKAFGAFSSEDQLLAITQSTVAVAATAVTAAKEYGGLSPWAQWLCIATLFIEYSTLGVSDTAPAVLLAAAPTFQGASEYDGYTAINREICLITP